MSFASEGSRAQSWKAVLLAEGETIVKLPPRAGPIPMHVSLFLAKDRVRSRPMMNVIKVSKAPFVNKLQNWIASKAWFQSSYRATGERLN